MNHRACLYHDRYVTQGQQREFKSFIQGIASHVTMQVKQSGAGSTLKMNWIIVIASYRLPFTLYATVR